MLHWYAYLQLPMPWPSLLSSGCSDVIWISSRTTIPILAGFFWTIADCQSSFYIAGHLLLGSWDLFKLCDQIGPSKHEATMGAKPNGSKHGMSMSKEYTTLDYGLLIFLIVQVFWDAPV